MNNFKFLNNITGWIIFIIATTVYTLTVEPTASFWDCGEFIACAYKMQVPHPPGAPMFLLIGKMFSFLAFGDVEKVAFWVNMLSVIASAFTILFLFWTITILAKKLIAEKGKELTKGQSLTVLFSGIIGALAYTFSDSFWFSAVEAEVYALSSFFTAIVFWAMLKWEAIDDESLANKWLIFIAYLIGLSIGVHLLNLVTLPALALIYYYKKFENHSKLGTFIAFVAGVICVGIIQVGIIPGLPTVAGKFEVLFVNSFGLPFGSGILFFVIVFIGAIVYGIIYSLKNKIVILNTALLALVFILIGYSSYMVIPIRSSFDPPLDENDPEDIMSFVSYLKREQYGERPILYGPTVKSQVIKQTEGDKKYRKLDGKYVVYDKKIINEYDAKHQMLFPRIHSSQQNHLQMYERWVKLPEGDKKISMGTNLEYFFKYQINFMFVRYFMWNFAGKAHDYQDAAELKPWDSNEELPYLMSNSMARNQFYMLPFFLGIIGVLFGLVRSNQISLVLGVLFFFTGIGIIIFLNQPPVEPRERDYTYAGAFYVYAIWIGLGVAGIAYWLKDILKNDMIRPIVAFVVTLIVPVIMAAEGWDDHDRSKRYFSVDSAKNLLNSCAKNAIIFTGGDNDTFPLWYVQEVEGFRTDVRVCNLSLLNTDWYINLMKQDAYDSKALPITMEFDEYIQGTNDYLPFAEDPRVPQAIDVAQFIKLIRQKNNPLQRPTSSGKLVTTFPRKTFTFPVDKEKVIASGIIPAGFEDKVEDRITWNIGKNGLEKKHLIMLDMIEQSKFERPIYFSTTISSSDYLNLQNYFQLEGLAYRFLPINNGNGNGRIETTIMYDRMMNDFFWRNMDDSTVFYDENYRRFPANTRDKFYRLASALHAENKNDKAIEVIDHCFKVMPDASVPYDATISSFVELLLKLDQKDKANQIMNMMSDRYITDLEYYSKNDVSGMFVESDIRLAMYGLNRFLNFASSENNEELVNKIQPKFQGYTQNTRIRQMIGM